MAAEAAVASNPYAMAAYAGFQIINGLQQAELIRDAAALSREVSNINAAFAEEDAAEALRLGLSEEARYQGVIDATLSAQKVALISSNIDPNFGTASEIRAETELTGFLNQIDLRNQAYANALGLKREAINIRTQGALGSIQSGTQAALTQSSAITSGIGTLGSAYSGYSARKGKE